ncbi:MAG: ParA family protein [Chloroflexota bacterium]
MTRTIVVANQKGGVGKTTTVANLGAALAMMGRRVLLIDLDSQGALTATFGLDPYNMPRSMYNIMLNENTSLNRTIRAVGTRTRLGLVPASVDLAVAEVQLVNANDRAQRLQNALRQNRIPLDFILIDTPPSLGMLTLNGLVSADEVLVPVQCQYLAMRGVRALMETIWRVKRRLNPDLRLLGLLPTMYHPSIRHSAQVVHEMREVFGPKVFDIVVRNSSRFAEAPVANMTLVEYAPEHEGAQAYRKLAEVIANAG